MVHVVQGGPGRLSPRYFANNQLAGVKSGNGDNGVYTQSMTCVITVQVWSI